MCICLEINFFFWQTVSNTLKPLVALDAGSELKLIKF